VDRLLGQEDYFKGYQESIDAQREEVGEQLEYDRLCYEALNTEAGKKLIEYFQNKIVMASVPAVMGAGYREACVYYEGYREGFRQIIHGFKSYPIRREAEEKAKLRGQT